MLVTAAIAATLLGKGAIAQPKFNDASNRMIQAFGRLDSLLNGPGGRLGVHKWTSGSGGFVKGVNRYWTRSFNLKAGVPMSTLIAGDNSVRQVSCAVRNNTTGKIEQRASGQADNFTFTFTPQVDGSYQVQTGIPGDVKVPSFVAVAYLKQDGVKIKSDRFGALTASIATTATIATSGGSKMKLPDNFCVTSFGALDPGTTVFYGAFNLGPCAFFGGTDIGRGGLGFAMMDQGRKNVLAEDKTADAIAGLPLEKGAKETFLRLQNKDKDVRMCYYLLVVP